MCNIYNVLRIIHKGMEFDICSEDPDLHKSCPPNDVCMREVARRNKVIIACQRIRELLKPARKVLSSEWWRH